MSKSIPASRWEMRQLQQAYEDDLKNRVSMKPDAEIHYARQLQLAYAEDIRRLGGINQQIEPTPPTPDIPRRPSNPEPPSTAPLTVPRRLSKHSEHRDAADSRTHPSRNFHLPHLATRDAAHAEELLAIYCGRLCTWGLATFEAGSPEARLLHELQALDYLMQASALPRTVTPDAYETEAHASAILELTREAMHAKDNVTGFRLSFEVDRHLYDIVEVTQCLHAAAVSTLLGLYLST